VRRPPARGLLICVLLNVVLLATGIPAPASRVGAKTTGKQAALPPLEHLMAKDGFQDALSRAFATILAEGEDEFYLALSDSGRARYRRRFWRQNDPTAATERNEFLEEYVTRLRYAVAYFCPDGGFGWDDRGDAVLRFGFPGSRAEITGDFSVQWGARGLIPNAEVWTYYDMRMTLQFIDPELNGSFIYGEDIKYRTAGPGPKRAKFISLGDKIEIPMIPRNIEAEHMSYRGQKYVEKGEKAKMEVPVTYGYAPPAEPITLFYEVVTAKGQSGASDLAVNYQLPMNSLLFCSDGETAAATLRKTIRVMTHDYDVLTSDTRTMTVSADNREMTEGVTLLTDEWRLDADPGEYIVGFCVEDTVTGRQGFGRSRIVVPDYTLPRLLLSDVQIASSVGEGTRFRRLGGTVVPQPVRAFDSEDDLMIYFEVYNLSDWEDGRSRFTVTAEITMREKDKNEGWFSRIVSAFSDEKRTAVSSSIIAYGDTPDTAYWTALSLENLEQGNYELTITLWDHVTDATVEGTATFTVVRR
jgi:GWxTD domain-containing protein